MNDLARTLSSINRLLGWHRHPRNGKVAKLPEPIRNLINQMLDDGLTYRAIIRNLQERASIPPSALPPGQIVLTPDQARLSEMNLSNWYRGGYQNSLRAVNISSLPAPETRR